MEYINYLDKVKGCKCIVIGDVMLDKYIFGDVSRISPEAPIPVVKVEQEKFVPGGAANVACNIGAMQLETILIGRVGEDENAVKLSQALGNAGVEFKSIVDVGSRTTTKTRVTGMSQQIVRIDYEDICDLDKKSNDRLIKILESEVQSTNVIIISDYNKGMCTTEICQNIISMARSVGAHILVDAKTSDWTKYTGADIVTPNFKEFTEAINVKCENSESDIKKYAVPLCEKYNLGGILITRSQHGMTYVNRGGKCFSFNAESKEVYDVSGAGDTVIATLSAFIALGAPVKEAAYTANVAAGIAVSKLGTYNVSARELFVSLREKEEISKWSAWTWGEAKTYCEKWSSLGGKIVFTNGCFDILHKGHVTYLNAARLLGDKLIVGLNTDESIRRIKGLDRPVNSQEDRALVLLSLSCVDGVVLFEEDTPYELLKSLKPDILVKGGDYKIEDVVGREFAKEVVLLPYVEGYSTTNIIQKMK